jgi:hypothetical protein
MKRRRPLVAISLVVMASIALATTTAFPADRFGGEGAGRPSIGDARPALPRPIVPHGLSGDRIVPHGFFTPPPPSHNFFPGAFFSHRPIAIGVIPPPVVYVLPPGSSESPVYYDAPVEPSVVYDPPALDTPPVPAAPSPPPTPNVVQYPTGRYELRGDGLTTPYIWVWIPNPPPPPPTAPPEVGALSPPDPSPPRHSRVYRWTDEQGILHLTDRPEAVPEPFRTQAKQDQPS